MIDWIFFDVGNVLFDDAPQDFEAMRYFHRAVAEIDPDYSFEQMLLDREELGKRGEKLILGQIAARFLSVSEIQSVYQQARRALAARYDQINLLLPGVQTVLGSLAGRFRLGVLANQPTECRASLNRRGLLDFFSVVAISDELRLRKPDSAIFEWALREANVSAERAIMIGDRRDNDILPASALGMKTVWIDWPSHQQKCWFPTDPQALLFLASTDRVPYFGQHEHLGVSPDVTVSTLGDVPDGIEQILVSR
jgi:5'-nucleotidase